MHRFRINRVHMTAGCLAAIVAAALLSTAALGQTPASAPDVSAPAQRIATEVLVAPRPAGKLRINYPNEEITRFGEGWVNVGMMVDTNGNPFEITVDSSSGNKVFERQAVESIERAKFKPGTLNGQPVDSSFEYKVTFVAGVFIDGARPEFIARYQALQGAIHSKDRAAADLAMKNLDVNNLYEDAFFGLASYAYALEWGTAAEQLAGLQRAVAHESDARYLPKSDFQAVQLQMFVLDIQLRHYAEALDLWPHFLTSDTSPATLEKVRTLMHQVDHIRLFDQAYDLHDTMPDGTWRLGLFEPNFRIRVEEGQISQVKLRCSKGFVRFAFDPNIQYKIATKYGHCSMELDGNPGTSFTLTQF